MGAELNLVPGEGAEDVGVDYNIVGDVISRLDTNIGSMDDLIPKLEKLVPLLGEGKDSDAIRSVLSRSKVNLATAKENTHNFKGYMGSAGASMKQVENSNTNYVLNAFNQGK